MRHTIPKHLVSYWTWTLAAFVVAVPACGASDPTAGTGAAAPTGSGGVGGQGGQGSGASGGDSASSGFIPSTSSSGSGGTGAGGGCGAPAMAECQTVADCDDGDASTTDACVVVNPGKEFETNVCVHVPCEGDGCTSQSVDPTCASGDDTVVYPPFVPLEPPDVPANCANGFELTNASGAPNYVIHSKNPAGSQALTLDLDFATYTAPDGLIITGTDGNCQPYVLFESCRLKTADQPFSAYGNGKERPDDIALRHFDLQLRPGTTELTFDFSKVSTPMYVRVLGLCDFDLATATGVAWFSLVPP
ncbi:MAG: hypothetical protein IPM54_25940 [Polyangiaceae bacterium]|nr:hypothetical protein [Polyangiaceae bacterium]